MHYIGELTTDGYGMAIIPIDLLAEYLASRTSSFFWSL